jgi:hypothetical protein
MNPSVGDYSPPAPRARRVQQAFPPASQPVFGHTNAIPAFIVDGSTTAAMVTAFGRAHPGAKMFVVNAAPRAQAVDPLAAALALRPQYWVVRRRAVVVDTEASRNVDLVDNFTRQDTNSLYPFDEFYTDRHVSIQTDVSYNHFGDYSIVGEHYRDGGGRANNVAIHHVYTIGPNPSDLRIRHYVSATHPDVTTMWYDALTQLVADLPVLARLSPLNITAVLTEYRAMHRSRHFPGLGKMKEIALRHHLLLMTVIQ